MSEQIDLRRSLRVVRRHWRAVLACVVAALLCGVTVTLLQPRTYVARSRVLLPPSGLDVEGHSVRNM